MWANLAFLGMLGPTAEVEAELEGALDPPEAPTIEALLAAIATSRADGTEPVLTQVTRFQDRPGGEKQVVIDVTKLGDEAVKGERLDLTIGSSAGGYRLTEAQRTLICARGVIDDGGRCL